MWSRVYFVYLVVVIIIIIAGVNKLLTSLSVVHVCVINLTTTVSAVVAKLPSSKLLSDFLGCVAAFDTSLFYFIVAGLLSACRWPPTLRTIDIETANRRRAASFQSMLGRSSQPGLRTAYVWGLNGWESGGGEFLGNGQQSFFSTS